jgi:hypothetical protein
MKFLLRLEGRKFLTQVDGTSRRVGFYASRLVEAANAESVDMESVCRAVFDELKDQGIQSIPESVLRPDALYEYEESLDDSKVGGFIFFVDETIFGRLLRKLTR